MSLIPEGQFDHDELLIDQVTLAWRVLLQPQQACGHLYHFALNPGITLQWWMRKRQGAIQEQGWQSPVSQQHTAGQRQRSGSQLCRPRGRRDFINGSCFGPNTQLADLTKCSVSPLPLFFLAWYNVCPHLTGGREGDGTAGLITAQGQRGCFQTHSLSSIKHNGDETLLREIQSFTTQALLSEFQLWWYFCHQLNYWSMSPQGVLLVK